MIVVHIVDVTYPVIFLTALRRNLMFLALPPYDISFILMKEYYLYKYVYIIYICKELVIVMRN